jgi:hypothetical protein
MLVEVEIEQPTLKITSEPVSREILIAQYFLETLETVQNTEDTRTNAQQATKFYSSFVQEHDINPHITRAYDTLRSQISAQPPKDAYMAHWQRMSDQELFATLLAVSEPSYLANFTKKYPVIFDEDKMASVQKIATAANSLTEPTGLY